MMRVRVVRTVDALRAIRAAWSQEGRSVALIPTMGALHEGHLALVREGMRQADRVIVSIFVNPTQFGPDEDFIRYSREEDLDYCLLATVGTSPLIFAPAVSEMYPVNFSTTITVSGISEGLCGAFRAVHFAGVATVVTKLLLQSLPDVALFGEKDYQQLQVIRRLVRDLNIPVRIISVPTVRESSGLALSSRNAYLSPTERLKATSIYQALHRAASMMAKGVNADTAVHTAHAQILAAGFDRIDYLEVCDADTLTKISGYLTRPARVLVAAWLGQTRLTDNVPVLPQEIH